MDSLIEHLTSCHLEQIPPNEYFIDLRSRQRKRLVSFLRITEDNTTV